jgi:hypothetical protein
MKTRKRKMTDKQKVHRAAFLMNWFLKVFNGRKAPFPKQCFKGIGTYMEMFLKDCNKYQPRND